MKEIMNIALALELVSDKKLARLDINMTSVGGYCGYAYFQIVGTSKLVTFRIFENGEVEKVEG